jgi:hypothetical protein
MDLVWGHVVFVGSLILPMPIRCKLAFNFYPSGTWFTLSRYHLSLIDFSGSGHPMVSTPRPRLSPLSSLVAWTSWVLSKPGRFRCPRNANSLLGWFCIVVVGRPIGFDVMVCGSWMFVY